MNKHITQRDIDIWRVEAKEMIRQMFEEWRKDYLGKRLNVPKTDNKQYSKPY